jgi:hypothetical protein
MARALPRRTMAPERKRVVPRWRRWSSWPLWTLWPALALTAAFILIVVAGSLNGYALDVFEYQCYAVAFWRGASGLAALPASQCDLMRAIVGHPLAAAPFHTIPVEYGALTLLALLPPLLAPAAWYPWLFAGEMILVIGATAWLCARISGTRAGHAYLLWLLVGAGMLVGSRFDALPALGTVLALACARRRWMLRAALLLAAATLIKWYPLVLLAPLVVAELRASGPHARVLRLPAAFGGVVAAGLGLTWLINPRDALRPLGFLAARGLELESLPASAIWLARAIGGAPATLVYEANVQTLAAPGAALAETAATVLGLALALAALWLQWRGRLTLGQAWLIALLALLVGSKVFSPQYVIWVAPLLALEAAPLALVGVLWLIVSALTALAFPTAYVGTFSGSGLPAWQAVAWISAGRNLALLACAGAALRWARAASPAGAHRQDVAEPGAVALVAPAGPAHT